MSESDVHPNLIPQEEEKGKGKGQQRLKYLDFVQVAAVQALVCLSRLYDFSKENSGPLKPGVESVEGTVKAVIGPVYHKFRGVPFEVLKFVDCKVGESIGEMEHHVPSLVKEVSSQAYSAAQKAPEVARSISGEVQKAGVIGTASRLVQTAYTKAEPKAKELYGKYEPVAEQYAVSAWRSLNRLPVFPQVAQVLVPTAAYWLDKYNKAVTYSADKGYAVFANLPLVPTERIAKVFGENGKAAEPTSE
ncbi:stress-related protein-like isoform X1 [Iris pallida]|uniref:Stress-related protein-like isoform X1 n=1 Tax=Iris pallida TaxID=29817 RepID=A0AAX6DWJ9_IRIPA|nr:stress-related protein-like isoform X1 [Iris pallida]